MNQPKVLTTQRLPSARGCHISPHSSTRCHPDTKRTWIAGTAAVSHNILVHTGSGGCTYLHVVNHPKAWWQSMILLIKKLFPTCQVRVVRFYVSLFSSLSFSFSSTSSSDLNYDLVCSVWRVGPQLRAREFSVACRTPTASPWVECGVPDPNRDPASSVWRPGPQPRSCELSVVCRTSTAILRVQCGVPNPNHDPVSSVWRAGPQVLCQKICQKEWQKICQKECQKICQKKCQKDMSERMSKDMSERCQKECQKICQKECQKICQKEW